MYITFLPWCDKNVKKLSYILHISLKAVKYELFSYQINYDVKMVLNQWYITLSRYAIDAVHAL